jgi:hypothetical protein
MCSFRCDFEDTAQYRASAMNVKGELSAYASVVVKSRFSTFVLFKCIFKNFFPLLKVNQSTMEQFTRVSLFFARI